ncbi:MAG: hypothetical protein RLZZ467_591, partial [Gemmatimonadota bacterium]
MSGACCGPERGAGPGESVDAAASAVPAAPARPDARPTLLALAGGVFRMGNPRDDAYEADG